MLFSPLILYHSAQYLEEKKVVRGVGDNNPLLTFSNYYLGGYEGVGGVRDERVGERE